MVCKTCKEDRELKYFKSMTREGSSKTYYLKTCKLCYGTKDVCINIFNNYGEYECRTCNTYREQHFFTKSIVSDKTYYATKKCKICCDTKVRIPVYSISDEAVEFLDKIKKQGGYIDFIDTYRLASHFTDSFGYIEYNLPIEKELVIMYNKLLRLKNNNIL